MAKKHLEKCSASLVIRETQIKTTLRFHLTPIRMTKVKGSNSSCWLDCGARGIFLHCWWKYKLVQPIQKSRWQFFIGNLSPSNPNYPSWVYILIGHSILPQGHLVKSIHSSFTHNSKKLETMCISLSQRMEKGSVVHLYNGTFIHLSRLKKKKRHEICS